MDGGSVWRGGAAPHATAIVSVVHDFPIKAFANTEHVSLWYSFLPVKLAKKNTKEKRAMLPLALGLP